MFSLFRAGRANGEVVSLDDDEESSAVEAGAAAGAAAAVVVVLEPAPRNLLRDGRLGLSALTGLSLCFCTSSSTAGCSVDWRCPGRGLLKPPVDEPKRPRVLGVCSAAGAASVDEPLLEPLGLYLSNNSRF